MEQERILKDLAAAVVDGDQDMVRESAEQALASQMDPLEAVDHGLSQGMAVIGEQFELGEVFLPELLMAADAFDAAMEILNPEIEAQKKKITRLGTVVLGTVKGDVHTIGKNIVATVLQINGFDVVDKASLPQKIWADCMQCVKFPECDEIAMLRFLAEDKPK